MKQFFPKAPEGALVYSGGDGKSPILCLNNSETGLAWLGEIRAAYEKENQDDSYNYRPPEDISTCALIAIKAIILKLETMEPFAAWDLCEELHAKHKSFNNQGFVYACSLLFE